MNYNSVELIYSTERLLFSLFFHFAHLYSAWLQQYTCVPSLENIFPGDNTHRFPGERLQWGTGVQRGGWGSYNFASACIHGE